MPKRTISAISAKKKKKNRTSNRLTVNVRDAAKKATDLNISQSVLLEIREYTEDIFIPTLVRFSGLFATKEGKKTIQERDYLRAKDFMNTWIGKADEYA